MQICGHFGVCGGCTLQDMPPADYAAHKVRTLQAALTGAGVQADILAPVSVRAHTRRRAVFKLRRQTDGMVVGFHAARSHTIVDMHQCLVLTPGLFALAGALRAALALLFSVGESAELHATETEAGFDCALRWQRRLTPALTTALSKALAGCGMARLMMNNNLVFETARPSVSLGGIPVALPPGSFLQPTRDGEAALQACVGKIVGSARPVADLFAGCGTFTFMLAARAKVHAVEQNAAALAALDHAAHAPGLKPVTTEARDLFRHPLTVLELSRFGAVVLDPPRAGAHKQAAQLAASAVPVIAYVSCDAASFARDAALLVEGGYSLGPVQPVDQFLWSSHIELVAGFDRKRK